MTDLNFDPTADRQPPCNVKAEEALLGGVLFDAGAISRVADIVSPSSFYLSPHQNIYRACLALHNQGEICDVLGVSTWLQDQGLLEGSGGAIALTRLLEGTVSAVNVDRYAELVEEKHRRRRLLEASAAIADLAHRTEASLEGSLGDAEKALFEVTQAEGRDASELSPLGDVLPESFNELEDLFSGTAEPGLPCGFYDLDAMTQGFQRSDLIIAAGRPAMGKTSFVLNIAMNVANAHGLPVVLYSLEMSKAQLTQRLLCGEAGIESGRLRSGRVHEREWLQISNAMAALNESPLFLCDAAEPTVTAMRSHLRKMKSQQGELGMVIIDYLQLMETPGDNRVQGLSKLTRSLKQMARELNVPIIALSQLSRGVEARTNKRPMMSDLRESGSLEQDSDLVLMLYRDEYYNPDTPDRGIAEVSIAKHRNGPTGTVKLLFEPQFTRFKNLSRKGAN